MGTNRNYDLYEVSDVCNVKELVYNNVNKYGDKIALKYKKNKDIIEVTYSNLLNDINYLGTSLWNREINNCKIAILGGNSYEWILSYLTILLGDNVAVPLDKELQSDELAEIINDSMCKVIIYDKSYSDVINKLKDMGLHVDLYINMNQLEKWILSGKDYLLNDNMKSYVDYTIQEDSTAVITYTSGTSGKSKGVMLTHKNIIMDGLAASKNVFLSNDTMLILPLHHTFCIIASLIAPMIQNRSIYINSNLKRLMEDFIVAKPQNVALVPLFIENMSKNIWKSIEKENKTFKVKTAMKISNLLLGIGIDLRPILFKEIRSVFGGNLDIIICGGALLDKKHVKEFRSFGIDILNGYGITECSPVVAVNRNEYYRDGSVGQIVSGCEVKIDTNGEILVKGHIVMKGYYNNPNENEKVFTDGWFRTGDIGYIDRDSFLYITGRIKNLIILANGKNVSPEEIEMKILKLKGVKEVIVFQENQKICCEIYPDYDFLNENCIKNYTVYIENKINEFNKTITSYKRINSIKFRKEEFLKTTTKKIKRIKINY